VFNCHHNFEHIASTDYHPLRAVASPGSGETGGGKTKRNFFVAHKMTRNNTLNKVHVAAATELPQLLSQNTNALGEATAQSRRQTSYTALKLTPRPFYGPFSVTTRVSRCQKRTSGLYGASED